MTAQDRTARTRRRAMLGTPASAEHDQPTDTITDAATARRRAMLAGQQEKETTDAT